MKIKKIAASFATAVVSLGMFSMAELTANASEVEYVDGLPTQIVNGDFQTFGNKIIDMRTGGSRWLTYVDSNGKVMGTGFSTPWNKFTGWDPTTFGWKSNDSSGEHNSIIELQRPSSSSTGSTGNVWSEICAQTVGKYIYQDIATVPGAVYTWSLDHASRNDGTADSMQVLIGPVGSETAQEAERVTSNGNDPLGDVGTTISTNGTGQKNQWETYEGTYVATSTVTRFTFKATTGKDGSGDAGAEGNLIDNVHFTITYPLVYDLNGGAGAIPNRA